MNFLSNNNSKKNNNSATNKNQKNNTNKKSINKTENKEKVKTEKAKKDIKQDIKNKKEIKKENKKNSTKTKKEETKQNNKKEKIEITTLVPAVEKSLKKKKKKKSILKILFIIFITFVIIDIIIAFCGYMYLKSKLDQIQYVPISPSEIYIDEQVEESLATYRNIALFGIDARKDTFSKGYRSDCIMILSLNEQTNEAKITSVYRDTYLNIDDYGLDKVTHAYSYGGAKLALNTLNKNLDLNITEFVAVNFDTVRTVVDSVGGIDIHVDSEEVKYINEYINSLNKIFGTNSKNINKAGDYTLDGVQALAYSRIRYTEGGDYKRTERMRDVLSLVFEKVKNLSIPELDKLSNEILPHVSTNITSNEIMSMLPLVATINITDSFGWPYETSGSMIKGVYYSVPEDLEDDVSRLHKELFNEEDYTPSKKVQSISDDIKKAK